MTEQRRDPVSRATEVLLSPVLSSLIGLAGVVVPVVAWVSERTEVRNALMIAETVIVIALTANLLWLRKAHITLRRVNNLKRMDDARFYGLIRSHLENELISDYSDIADGHMRVYASEVPQLSVLLVDTLTASASTPRRILAADLTTNPSLLTQRHDYLAANRRFVESGGDILRLFIAYRDDLVEEHYATSLLELIDRHRGLGVTCGIAVRDRLRAEEAVDFIVFASAAVLVEEEQGDSTYRRGRSSVYFKGVERWTRRFESAWGQGSDAGPRRLEKYEAAVRPMLGTNHWVQDRVDAVLDSF
ncbi:hypothetical protein YW5DRAFT_01920 [Streptomyces sp. Ncost-T6T-1]|uniref:hypothetical protein n=1 Tax=Streptomyces sp. Ncost-T6T-1 TaxID=1100828 RepID=UPI000804E8C2|nr:hypothetical protein [Streptomyces sp. Ncost-T6T-1]SBV00599.1 hypothetical protein YW5DRAFT_01920 [Streptomyces sp. Ncost-T6T-1]